MKKLIAISILLAAVIGGYFLFRDKAEAPVTALTPAPGTLPGEVEEAVISENKGINMTSDNFFFAPNKLVLQKGEPIKITFQNIGFHTFVIDELGVKEQLIGEKEVIEFTPDETGTFEYYCDVPGHKERGMFGSLTVE